MPDPVQDVSRFALCEAQRGSRHDRKVREFQTDHKMAVDGLGGPRTWRGLRDESFQLLSSHEAANVAQSRGRA